MPTQHSVEEAKKVKENADASKDELEAAVKALNDKIMPIVAKMYEAAAKEESSEADSDEEKKDDGPVEGEVVDDDKKDEK